MPASGSRIAGLFGYTGELGTDGVMVERPTYTLGCRCHGQEATVTAAFRTADGAELRPTVRRVEPWWRRAWAAIRGAR
jgi:hypothetical protein